MLGSNAQKLAYLLLLAFAGAAYFVPFAGLDMHPLLKNQLVLLPVQVGVLVYLLWRQREQRSI